MSLPNGDEVSYAYDAADRLTRVNHSAFGEITYSYDHAGNMLTASAGSVRQSWKYGGGFPIEYESTDLGGASSTRIERDAIGRIVRIHSPDGTTSYGYDEAGQLITANGKVSRAWCYDLSGRLIRERDGNRELKYAYDLAGQLASLVSSDDGETTYRHDGAGRRTHESGQAGDRELAWDERGWLIGITTEDRYQSFWVDALGDLSGVDSVRLSWDAASTFPSLTEVEGAGVSHAPGFIGIDGEWRSSGWRLACATNAEDPWELVSTPDAGLMPIGVLGVTGRGTPILGGLEWMGARVYDPNARRFLSVDPLPPVVGAGWEGNPYSYAGNDPLQALDPLGLRPLTDPEFFDFVNPFEERWEGVRNWAKSDDRRSWSFWLARRGSLSPSSEREFPTLAQS